MGTPEAQITDVTEEEWLHRCAAISLDHKRFTAGQPRAHVAAYNRFFGLPGPLMVAGTFKRTAADKLKLW